MHLMYPSITEANKHMKSEILRILKNSTDYVSGQELCNLLGVSRTAVWKVMNQLKEEGYQIDSVSKKGYRLLESPDILSKEEIKSQMETVSLGTEVVYLDAVDSTNTYAKSIADNGGIHGTLVVAGMQTVGKGRRGRTWVSPKDTGIWMTLILKPDMKPVGASMLTLVAGLAVARAITQETGEECQIKWPNDIVMNGRKVCGILTEMSTEFDYINHVVVGIGINANIREFPEELQQTASSLLLESGHAVHRAKLIARVMKEMESCYEIFLRTQDMSALMAEYNERLVSLDKEVVILRGNDRIEAVSLGIDKEGELLIRTRDNHIEKVVAGEVSVRGVYGYV